MPPSNAVPADVRDEGRRGEILRPVADDVRAAYVAFYDEAEAVAQSSVVAARREGREQAGGERPPPTAPLATRARRRIRRAVGK